MGCPDVTLGSSGGRSELGSLDGHLLLGHLPEFSKDAPGFLADLAHEHGALARFRVAHQRYVLVSDPDPIEQILVRQHTSFHKHDRLRDTLGEALGQGLLTAEDGTWLEHRQLAQPAFRPRRIEAYGPAMVDLTQATIDRWQDGQAVELNPAMMALTLRIAAKTLFGVDVAEDADRIGQALEAIMARFKPKNRLVSLLPSSLPLPSNLAFRRGVSDLASFIDDLIDQRQAQGTLGKDLLSRLLAAREEDTSIDDQGLRDELVTLLVAGHETTALTLTWTFDLLGRHPEIEARLHEELDDVLAGDLPTVEHLDDLVYLEAVVDEAMRLYPPAWAIGRKAIEPVTLGGHRFETGTQFMMSQWVMHRDGRFFDEPLAFRPERWLDGLHARLPRFAYFPFGGGPRTCIGNSFALMEAKLIIATIASRYRLVPLTDEVPGTDPSITLRPEGTVPVEVQARRPSQPVAVNAADRRSGREDR